MIRKPKTTTIRQNRQPFTTVRHTAELFALAIVAGLSEIDTSLLTGRGATGVAALTAGIAVGLAMVAAPSLPRRFRDAHGTAALSFLLAAIALGAVTSAWSIDPASSAIKSLIALCFVAAVAGVFDRSGFGRTMVALSCALAGVVIASLVWELVGPGTPINPATGVHDPGLGGLPRLSGVTEHPNQFGRVSGLLVIIGLALARIDSSRTVRWGLITIGFAGLVVSQSRTSMVAVIVAFLAFRLLDRRWLVPVGVAVAGSTALLLAPLAGVSVLGLVTRNGQSSELLTATGRSSIWKTAWRLAWEHPLGGSGAFTSPQRMRVAMDTGEVGLDAVDPHNLFLSLFLNGGLLMLALFAAFLWAVISQSGPHSGQVAAARRVLAGLALWSMTESLLPGLNTNLMLCALAGAAMTSRRAIPYATDSTNNEDSHRRPVPHRVLAGTAISLAFGGAWAGLHVARTSAPQVTVTQALTVEDVPPHEVASAHLAISETVGQSRAQFPNVVPPVDATWVRPLDPIEPNFAIAATATTAARAESVLSLVIGDIEFIEDLGFALTAPRANLAAEFDLVERHQSSGVEVVVPGQPLTTGNRRQAEDADLQDRWAAASRAEVFEIRAATVAGTERDLVERLALRTARVGEPVAAIPTGRSAIGSLAIPMLVGLSWAGYQIANGRRVADSTFPDLSVAR